MNDKKVIITKYEEKICSFLIHNNRLLAVNTLSSESRIGSIYVGKVKNVLHNIQACFVEIANKEICFLPFRELTNAYCLNRSLHGLPVSGDELLVQITKDISKNKQASVSCNITYTSDLFVFTSGNLTFGISSKLNKMQKDCVKKLFIEEKLLNKDGTLTVKHDIIIPGFGCIVRTGATDVLEVSKEEFLNIYKKEQLKFLAIFQKALHSTCFQCIHTPYLPYESLFASFGTNEYDEVITDLNEAFTALQGTANALRLYEDVNYPLYKLYSLESKIQEALGKRVWLKSGANLIIESTECLTTIDVNSAKAIQGNLSHEMIQQINMEAAKEAALQIRLRNLSGIIIIDFINMSSKDDENELIEYMKKLVSNDSTTTIVIDITPLGLMELTRKKISKTLSEQLKG